MATGGVDGNGVKVAYSLTSPISWVTVPQLLDESIPTFSSDEIDTTVHSTSKYKRSIPGMITVGDFTFKVLADLDEVTTPSHNALAQLNVDGTTVWWRVEIPTNREKTRFKAWEFQGYIKEFKPSAAIGAREEIDVTVKFDGTSFTRYAAGASAIS